MSTEEKLCEGVGSGRWPEREVSPGSKPAGTLILDIPAFRTSRNKFLLFKPKSMVLLWQSKRRRYHICHQVYQESSACCLWWVSVSYVHVKRLIKEGIGLLLAAPSDLTHVKATALLCTHLSEVEHAKWRSTKPIPGDFIQLFGNNIEVNIKISRIKQVKLDGMLRPSSSILPN